MATKTYTKAQFLKDVEAEARALREHATKEELGQLVIEDLDPTQIDQCIYGQMTGSCASSRAKHLMNKSCVRIFDLTNCLFRGVDDLQNTVLKNLKHLNGKYEGQMWKRDRGANYPRRFTYLSAVEGYICANDANNANLIAFLKGETNELNL